MMMSYAEARDIAALAATLLNRPMLDRMERAYEVLILREQDGYRVLRELGHTIRSLGRDIEQARREAPR